MLGFLTKLITPVTDLVSEYVVDKDKANELVFKISAMYEEGLKSAREHDKASYGITIVDAVRGLIRPIITFGFGALFVVAKFYPEKGIILTDQDYLMIGGVMTFWFGGRFLGRDIQK